MKRDIKKQESKQKIIEAALYLFSTKSFTNISIRDIAKQANVSPALIYKYFKDQQQLYIETMKLEGIKLISRLKAFSRLEELTLNYVNYMFKENVLYQMMAYFMLEANRPHTSIPIFAEISELIGIFEQSLKPIFQEEAKSEAQLLFSTLNGLLITYKNYPGFTSEQALEHITFLVKRYIGHLPS
ncbi:TetR/AcrR family transcriptional regulator [Cytobacillus sp. Hz8]|uniref:TetR/AcrR family transcriptional regulator n=1 Tax=Cytobacillus sp. Hz8 TaxID=3347168 RepID=UPI0035DF96C3